MSVCDQYEGLIAQSLYEPLTESEQNTLSAHLDTCTACNAEIESLSTLQSFIPVDPIVFEGNLRPVLEERVRSAKRPRGIRIVFSGICGVAVIVMMTFSLLDSSSNESPGSTVSHSDANNYFTTVLAQARGLMGEEQYPQVYVVLHNAIEDTDASSVPVEARELLAKVAYENLRWYPEAYAAYDQLRMTNPTFYQGSDISIQRYSLLDEARVLDSEYASLHAWNRIISDDDIDALGTYIQQYPGTFHASDAVQEMARILSVEQDRGGMPLESVLEVALLSTDDPIIVAQIKLELGRHYWKNSEDSEKARVMFEEVENSGNTMLAKAATQSLRALQSE